MTLQVFAFTPVVLFAPISGSLDELCRHTRRCAMSNEMFSLFEIDAWRSCTLCAPAHPMRFPTNLRVWTRATLTHTHALSTSLPSVRSPFKKYNANTAKVCAQMCSGFFSCRHSRIKRAAQARTGCACRYVTPGSIVFR